MRLFLTIFAIVFPTCLAFVVYAYQKHITWWNEDREVMRRVREGSKSRYTWPEEDKRPMVLPTGMGNMPWKKQEWRQY